MGSPARSDDRLDLAGLGERIRLRRLQRRLSLDELALRSGVSRSMISSVERGKKVPTVVVLSRIATALDASIARLLGEERSARVVLLRREQQDVVRDESGLERRVLSPVLPSVEFVLVRGLIPPGVTAGLFRPHAPGTREYLAVESGELRVTIDSEEHRLMAGDSLYFAGDCFHGVANERDRPCVYYVASDINAGADLPGRG
ncbi:MAG: cupin domain-containing protein [Chloroflexi bacterium]|nr:cupin domain-containing protein [Chloroflexota bacterium]